MSQQEVYVAKMEAQLQDWRSKMDAMKARLEEAEMQERLEFHRQVEASQRQHEVACRHLDELKHSGEQAWAELRGGVESAWKELRTLSSKEPG